MVGSGELTRFAQIAGAAVAGAVLLLGGALSPAQARSAAASSAAAPGSYRQNDFSADPGWEGQRNHSNSRCAKRSFSFGWSGTTLASSTPGEIGGKIERSSLYRAYYAERLPAVRSLDDSLTVTGTIRVPKPNGGGALLGWFDAATSYDWRTPDFLGLRVNGVGSKARLSAEYGTANTFAAPDLGDPGVGLEPRRRYAFTLEYEPDQGDFGTGLLRLTVVPPGGAPASTEISIVPAHRADGATFDHFGLLNVQLDGRPMTVYVGNLAVDGTPVDLTSAPPWDSENTNLSNAVDCRIHDRQDFGYSSTSFAGSAAGEIGGLVWRSTKRRTAYYADPTSTLTLQDSLYAEGLIDLESAAPDSDLFIGWFSRSSTLASSSSGTPANLVAAQLGGPSAWGFRLFPAYHTSGKLRGSLPNSAMSTAPMLTPKHHPWEWWVCYQPNADSAGNGRLTVGLADPTGARPVSSTAITVPPEAKTADAQLDRFGIRNLETGGHDVVVYLDELRYTVGPGDAGPGDRCG